MTLGSGVPHARKHRRTCGLAVDVECPTALVRARLYGGKPRRRVRVAEERDSGGPRDVAIVAVPGAGLAERSEATVGEWFCLVGVSLRQLRCEIGRHRQSRRTCGD